MKPISNMFLSIFVLMSLCIAGNDIDSTKSYPGSETFFPLLSGSYWVFRDTFISDESFQIAAEGCNCDNPTEWKKDSVLSCVKSDSGYMIQIVQTRGNVDEKLQKRLSKTRKPVYFYYRCFEGKINKYGSVWADLNPTPGDTLLCAGPEKEKMYYKQCKNDTVCRYLVPLNNNGMILCFKKGIGLVGLIAKNSGKNLIEYRIGNGPVVKKHWLMEAPVKK